MNTVLKYALLCCLLLKAMVSMSQTTYRIDGKVESKGAVTWAYLYTHASGVKVLDSVRMDGSFFTFSGKIEEVLPVSIRFKGMRRSVDFYLEPGVFEVKVQEEWSKPSYVVGGVQNAIKKSYEADTRGLLDSMSVLSKAYETADEEGKVRLGLEMQGWNDRVDAVRTNYLQAYPSSIAVLDWYRPYFTILNYVRLKDLKDSFSPSLSSYASYQELEKYYKNKKEEYKVGSQAPEVKSKTVEGKEFKLSQLKGKLVLLDFWASWCAPCRIANRKLVPVYEKYKGKGFEIVSFSMDDKSNLWKDAIKKDGIPWVQVSDLLPIQHSEVAKGYHVRQLPTLFLIDEDGVIIKQNIDHDDLVEYLKEKYDEKL